MEKITSIFLFLTFAHLAFCSEVEEKFKKSEIVPNIIEVAPKEKLSVKYTNANVQLGNKLKASDTTSKPTITFSADDTELYTLMLIDPDAPRPEKPEYAQFIHCMVINIPGNKISDGTVILDYKAPSPPTGSDAHRYIFLLYKQENKLDDVSISSRVKFSIKTFSQEHKLGEPRAGNFFYLSIPQ